MHRKVPYASINTDPRGNVNKKFGCVCLDLGGRRTTSHPNLSTVLPFRAQISNERSIVPDQFRLGNVIL